MEGSDGWWVKSERAESERADTCILNSNKNSLKLATFLAFSARELPIMPLPCRDFYLWQSYPDVGGCDLWVANAWVGYHSVWVGWHSPRNICSWHLTRPSQWKLIGYQIWRGAYQVCGTSVYPNPSMTPKGIDLTLRGCYEYDMNLDGTVNHYSWKDEILTWEPIPNVPEDTKGKGLHKGQFAKSKPKGKGESEDRAMGKGKGKGTEEA